MTERTLGNKRLYKIFIIVAKYISYILALTQIVGIIFSYFNITCIWLSIFGGCSIGIIGLLFLISIVFRFCLLHRMPLYYTSSIYLLQIIDNSIGIPLGNLMLFRLHFIIIGITLLLYVFLYYKNRRNPKVDHIKEFCSNYGIC